MSKPYGFIGLVRPGAVVRCDDLRCDDLLRAWRVDAASQHGGETGIMGEAMARNLLKLGCGVVVYNRSPEKCAALVAEGATAAPSPAAVLAACDVTFGMLSDPAAAEAVVFGPAGVLEGAGPGKAYVDMSTVDAGTSRKIGAALSAAGARFLEAPVSGSKKPAIDGQLVILAAGDASLYAEVAPAFGVMGKKSFFLGPTGAGAHMKLVVMGSMVTAFAESMALAEAAGLSQSDLQEVLALGAVANPMFALKGPAMVAGAFPPAFPLKHQQKDLRLALALGDEVDVALPVAAAANEVFKRAKAQGLGDADMAAVYQAVKGQGDK